MPSDYEAIRKQHLDDYGRKTTWRQSVLADRYSERTHFIFELLQNAEDAGATRVEFRVLDEQLEIRHDGRDFNTKDVTAISAIDESTKPADEGMIGRFGIGFKSVYAFTTAPQVHCPGSDEHFEIRDFVEPWPVRARRPGKGWTTLFVLPFDREQVSAEQSVAEIAERLLSLSPRTVLFLRHLRVLTWKAVGFEAGMIRRDEIPEAGARRVSLIHGAATAPEEEWLVFQQSVEIAEGRHPGRVEVAFLVVTADGEERIAIARDTELVAFFPTARQTNLGFLLQAPFVLTPDRDNIMEAHTVNEALAQAAGGLLVGALEHLRDRGLLTVTALQALPLDVNAFPERSLLRPLYDAVRQALLTKRLFPTANGRHLPAPQVRMTSDTGLRELLSGRQLTSLLELDEPVAWASPEISVVRTPVLYRYLVGFKSAYEPDVPALVRDMALYVDDVVELLTPAFLEAQTDEWMIRLYQWLGESNASDVTEREIVRTEDGRHVAAHDSHGRPQVWLPPRGETAYQVVRRKIARAKRAEEFLQDLGLTEPDAVDEVRTAILPKFASKRAVDDEYWSDLERIAQALRSSTGAKRATLVRQLKTLAFLVGRNAASGERFWKRPVGLYEPSEKLLGFYAGNSKANFLVDECLPQLDCWRELDLVTDFEIERTLPDRSGYVTTGRHWHGHHERGRDGYDPDLSIDGLDYAVENPNPERSRVVWNLLATLKAPFRGVIETSTRQDYSNSRPSDDVSEVGELVESNSWLLDRDGEWRRPAEVSLDDLAPGYARNESLAKRLGMLPTVGRELAEYLDIDLDDLDVLRQNPDVLREAVESARRRLELSGDGGSEQLEPATPPDVIKAFRDAFDRPGESDLDDAVPYGLAGDPERRHQRAVEALENAAAAEPPATDRWRAVPRKEWEARDPTVREYLLQTYGGRCQICEATFAMRNGKPYFEARYLVTPTLARWVDTTGNALCLCPTCLAKMLHGSVNGQSVVEQVEGFAVNASLFPEGTSIDFELCGEPTQIRFAQRHLIDLGALLDAAQSVYEDAEPD